MTGQQLKNAILALAVQGKLVPQNPKDEPASELLKQIAAEKARLVAEGKIKKEKPLPEITDEEKPFEIPAGWKWVRLGDIAKQIGDIDHKMPQTVKENGIPYISPLNFTPIGIDFDSAKQISIEDYERLSQKICPVKDDIIFPRYGTIGVIRRVNTERKFLASYSCCIIKMFNIIMSLDYVECVLRSPLIQSEINRYINKTTQPNVGLNSIKNFLFPLPPLAEQKRIVAKIEELLPIVDAYDEAEQKLSALDADFPDKLKKSILQQAVQGKLAKQDKNDEPASELLKRIKAEKEKLLAKGKIKKEKPLPSITEEEKPFALPEGWEWVRLGEAVDVRDGTHDTPAYVSKGIPLVTSKNLCNGEVNFDNVKYISKEDAALINNRSYVDDGDILYAMIGSIGNPAIVKKTFDFCIKNVALFKNINHTMDMNCLLYFFMFLQEEMRAVAAGSAQSFVSLRYLRNYPIPLPPFAEQKRIVEQVEEYLALCDKMNFVSM